MIWSVTCAKVNSFFVSLIAKGNMELAMESISLSATSFLTPIYIKSPKRDMVIIISTLIKRIFQKLISHVDII